MPDAWEKAHQLDPAKANANGKSLIEVYINSLVKDIVEAQVK
ncbi:hypothetical protein GCM10023188_43570 [Pontibacter saemangeumensis]|uniref:Uncharacterized protein n=1 Tax=Pontibacter saemangeumensis TaxID=1084525 RepID=A0ABP8M259_9BACT